MGLFGWVIFLFALCLSITWHETGHFVTAKMFGMKATRYFVGFGPTLWSVQRGETEYGIKALPIGGFVKIIGMHSLDDVDDPADEPRSFRQQPGWQRIVVLVAGIVMNLVLAFVLVAGLALTIGIEKPSTARISTQVVTVASCVADNVTDLNNESCGSSKQPSPAKLAGVRAGDTITSYNGKPVSDWTKLGALITNTKPGTVVALTVRRGASTLTLHAKVAEVPGRKGGYMGIVANSPPPVFQIASPLGAVKYAGSFFGQVITGTGSAIGSLPSAIPKLFTKERADSSGGQICSVICAGEATSQAVSASVGWQYKAEFVVLLVAELNILLGLFNILPLMPLDGGLAAVIAWERFRAWLARLRGRSDPGMVDIRKVLPVMFSIFMVVVLFTVVVLLADIVNPVNLGL